MPVGVVGRARGSVSPLDMPHTAQAQLCRSTRPPWSHTGCHPALTGATKFYELLFFLSRNPGTLILWLGGTCWSLGPTLGFPGQREEDKGAHQPASLRARDGPLSLTQANLRQGKQPWPPLPQGGGTQASAGTRSSDGRGRPTSTLVLPGVTTGMRELLPPLCSSLQSRTPRKTSPARRTLTPSLTGCWGTRGEAGAGDPEDPVGLGMGGRILGLVHRGFRQCPAGHQGDGGKRDRCRVASAHLRGGRCHRGVLQVTSSLLWQESGGVCLHEAAESPGAHWQPSRMPLWPRWLGPALSCHARGQGWWEGPQGRQLGSPSSAESAGLISGGIDTDPAAGRPPPPAPS